jgi:hypothetical protein
MAYCRRDMESKAEINFFNKIFKIGFTDPSFKKVSFDYADWCTWLDKHDVYLAKIMPNTIDSMHDYFYKNKYYPKNFYNNDFTFFNSLRTEDAQDKINKVIINAISLRLQPVFSPPIVHYHLNWLHPGKTLVRAAGLINRACPCLFIVEKGVIVKNKSFILKKQLHNLEEILSLYNGNETLGSFFQKNNKVILQLQSFTGHYDKKDKNNWIEYPKNLNWNAYWDYLEKLTKNYNTDQIIKFIHKVSNRTVVLHNYPKVFPKAFIFNNFFE